MRAPVSWLREYTDIPESITHDELHAALVRVGLEEEAIHTFEVTGPVVVGQVVSFEDEPQSNGKTIRWCQVDVGEAAGGVRGIVCGANNFVVGDKVAVALPGSVLPGPFPITARKTYGHTSDGMIASAKELGLGDEHDGILRLAALGLDPEVGEDAIPLLGLDDFSVEVNITPDRGYALSIRGIAREYSNSTGAAFRDPADRVKVVDADGYPVVLTDDAPIRGRAGCSVFTARVVRGVHAAWPTPPWMLARLILSGVRSISLIVDIGNYVMLELGQPIHTYDLAKVDPGGLIIRRAKKGETLETLDGKERKLDQADLVVADATGAIGLAGVMGGASTEISDTSTDVLVEAGIWDPVTIARTVRRHKLPSEAARRYERGVDPRMSKVGAARVVELLVGARWRHRRPARVLRGRLRRAVRDRASHRLRERADRRGLHRRRDRRGAHRDRRGGRAVGGRLERHPADLASRTSRMLRPWSRRSPASSATTASHPCCRWRLPVAASPASSGSVAPSPRRWPMPGSPRCSLLRSSRSSRTTASAVRSRARCRRCGLRTRSIPMRRSFAPRSSPD